MCSVSRPANSSPHVAASFVVSRIDSAASRPASASEQLRMSASSETKSSETSASAAGRIARESGPGPPRRP
ncbi:hypothetical protein ABC795_07215 [Blastococcus sp. HT6-30]|uniref:hypothetical protein n=1 Tax=Blastococcus sp. HT6-30 TaxID=3144843 RepID=UPI00321B0924